ncbi:hypothetical protein [Candidatus Albibeggiatoa sp. nov. BB20]
MKISLQSLESQKLSNQAKTYLQAGHKQKALKCYIQAVNLDNT